MTRPGGVAEAKPSGRSYWLSPLPAVGCLPARSGCPARSPRPCSEPAVPTAAVDRLRRQCQPRSADACAVQPSKTTLIEKPAVLSVGMAAQSRRQRNSFERVVSDSAAAGRAVRVGRGSHDCLEPELCAGANRTATVLTRPTTGPRAVTIAGAGVLWTLPQGAGVQRGARRVRQHRRQAAQ